MHAVLARKSCQLQGGAQGCPRVPSPWGQLLHGRPAEEPATTGRRGRARPWSHPAAAAPPPPHHNGAGGGALMLRPRCQECARAPRSTGESAGRRRCTCMPPAAARREMEGERAATGARMEPGSTQHWPKVRLPKPAGACVTPAGARVTPARLTRSTMHAARVPGYTPWRAGQALPCSGAASDNSPAAVPQVPSGRGLARTCASGQRASGRWPASSGVTCTYIGEGVPVPPLYVPRRPQQRGSPAPPDRKSVV